MSAKRKPAAPTLEEEREARRAAIAAEVASWGPPPPELLDKTAVVMGPLLQAAIDRRLNGTPRTAHVA